MTLIEKWKSKQKKQMKDYCDNDCDATKEVAIAVTNYLYKHEIRKEQKMENNEVTKDELWSKVIKDLKTLNQEAKDEDYVPYITDALVLAESQLYIDDTTGTIKQEDKSHMWSLVDKIGCYSIKGETIMYLPVYQELTALLRKVF